MQNIIQFIEEPRDAGLFCIQLLLNPVKIRSIYMLLRVCYT